MTDKQEDTKLTAADSQAVVAVQTQAVGLIAELTTAFPGTEIASDDDLTRASEALTRITKATDEWEQMRVSIVTPANHFVRHINGLWKRMIDPVKLEEGRIRNMMSGYRAREQQRRQAEYAASLKQAEEAITDIFPGGSPIPETVAPIPQDSLKHVTTANGSVGFTTVWKWVVEDADKIPREYWMLNETMITKVVKAGMRSIPGLRVYSEQVPSVRRA